ncbi:sulfate ABC transporter ATP-binding protein [Pelagicoccus sp. SDUM812003]|uniref:sulfate/molybdate ABC transporter ATP-binding protein n=1 Tax=Pelagicoccus sp. SDUM812003 TaxID=3041267 RepID=UPI00280F99FF|nr:sulfate ABC transporter ATP-binding protein [Pelagicoccus sp. SDUM812003]MDQ8205580.1 sulfate ABC transporter ATP-binding protein [Pelagicoccus sp. SDUM812003]
MSIHAKNISKTFGRTVALDNVTLEVPSGELVALVGPSGSGKTTLLRILSGLESPDERSGNLFFHGENVSNIPARQRQVGMVFQHYALFRHMTVRDNIAFGLAVRPKKARPTKAEIDAKVSRLLELVQLSGLENRLPGELSGGQRQRIALARALAIEPKVLLLDEPFGALDAKVRKDLRRWLRHFHEELRLTTVFVTHDQEEALELADQVVVMNHARIEQVGTPQNVFDHPASPFVIEFMGNVNRLASGFGNLKVAERDQLYVRPHDIEILSDIDASPLSARVQHIFSAGSVGSVALERLDTREQLEAEVSRSELDELQLQPGQNVSIRFRHIRLFEKSRSGRLELVERLSEQGEIASKA